VTKLHGDNVLDSTIHGEAAVLRLRKDKDYEPEVLFWDDGKLITMLTGAAVDPVNGRLIAGGVVEKHFVVCDISGKL
jgi:arylesterase/paraoxonase